MQGSQDIGRLIGMMAALRTPKTGCPWDLEQTHRSLAPYAIEEAYEVVDAIERDDVDDLREELGDLLLQVVFHARLAEEAGTFSFGDVVDGVTRKLVRRHPHVFPPETKRKIGLSGVDIVWEAMKARRLAREGGEDADDHGSADTLPIARDRTTAAANATWEKIKAEERAAKNSASHGVLAGVPEALPGLSRAVKLQNKAAGVGFDWNDARLVIAKIREEIDEIEHELIAPSPTKDAVRDEIGDLIFAVANLARHVDVDPDTAVRGANRKFERRFAYIEKALLEQGSSPQASTLDEMDRLWDEAKAAGL